MRAVTLSLFALSLVACGPNGVNEPCAYPGETTDCVDGAICTPDLAIDRPVDYSPTWSTYTCRTDCGGGLACPAGFECRGVTGREMLSTCQPIPATAP